MVCFLRTDTRAGRVDEKEWTFRPHRFSLDCDPMPLFFSLFVRFVFSSIGNRFPTSRVCLLTFTAEPSRRFGNRRPVNRVV